MFNKLRYRTKKTFRLFLGCVIMVGITTINYVTENYWKSWRFTYVQEWKRKQTSAAKQKSQKSQGLGLQRQRALMQDSQVSQKYQNNKRHLVFRSFFTAAQLKKLTSSYRYNDVYHFALNFAAKRKT